MRPGYSVRFDYYFNLEPSVSSRSIFFGANIPSFSFTDCDGSVKVDSNALQLSTK